MNRLDESGNVDLSVSMSVIPQAKEDKLLKPESDWDQIKRDSATTPEVPSTTSHAGSSSNAMFRNSSDIEKERVSKGGGRASRYTINIDDEAAMEQIDEIEMSDKPSQSKFSMKT